METKTRLLSYPSAALIFMILFTGCRKESVTDSTATVTDADGNEYSTVTIGEQVWMLENLRTTKYNDGTSIPNITDNQEWAMLTTPGVCSYNNTTNADTLRTYGRLYNWYAVNTGKLCPAGWHVPDNNDFIALREYLIANGYNYDGSTSPNNGCAKSLAAQTGWVEYKGNAGAPGNYDYMELQNASGFTGYPAGQRGTIFNDIGYFAIWWTQSEQSDSHAWRFYLSYALPVVYNNISSKHTGYSVRCLED